MNKGMIAGGAVALLLVAAAVYYKRQQQPTTPTTKPASNGYQGEEVGVWDEVMIAVDRFTTSDEDMYEDIPAVF